MMGAIMEVSGSIRDVLKLKGSTEVWSVDPKATVFEAIGIMADKHVGALLVLSEGRLAGLISERDYARSVDLKGKSSKQIQVTEIMTSPVLFVAPQRSVGDCMRIMTDGRIRHLPVVEGDQVVGLVSIGDLVRWVITQQAETIRQLTSYITGGM
jgi:CBS domain-containing protein